MAIYTVCWFLDSGWVVALSIKLTRKFNNVPRAELDAISASFAAIFKYMNLAAGDMNLFYVKWNPPIHHYPCLKIKSKGLVFVVKAPQLYELLNTCQWKT